MVNKMYRYFVMMEPKNWIQKSIKYCFINVLNRILYQEFFNTIPRMKKGLKIFRTTLIIAFFLWAGCNILKLQDKLEYSNWMVKTWDFFNIFKEDANYAEMSDEYLRYRIKEDLEITVPDKVNTDHLLLMIKESKTNGIPLDMYLRIVKTESNFDSTVVSHAGAFGFMQIMPETFTHYYNIMKLKGGRTTTNNIKVGCKLLAELHTYWNKRKPDESWKLALASYNAGIGNVIQAGGNVPDFKETRNYINKILRSNV